MTTLEVLENLKATIQKAINDQDKEYQSYEICSYESERAFNQGLGLRYALGAIEYQIWVVKGEER